MIYRLSLTILLSLFAMTAQSACVPSGTNGSAVCGEEGEAQMWVADTAHQSQGCGQGDPTNYFTGVSQVTFEGETNRIANFKCNYSGGGAPSSSYIVAYFTTDCAARNATSTAVLNRYVWPSCNAGCTVQDSGYRETTVNFSPTGLPPQTGKMLRGALQFTGTACAPPAGAPPGPEPEPTPPDEDQCIAVGNLTQCQKPNGDQCATASNGVQHCWNPDAPPVVPTVSPDGSISVNNTTTPEPNPAGQPAQGTITNTTINNSTTTNTSVTVSGPAAGTGGTGTSTCPTGTTGTPPNCTATGGGGTNTTPAPAACPAGVDCTGAGSATGPMGVVYTKGTDTIGSVIGDHFSDIGNYPIVNAAQAFLGSDCFLSGACPELNMQASEYLGEVGSDAFCSPAGALILAFASYVLLAGASYAAFRIAFDN